MLLEQGLQRRLRGQTCLRISHDWHVLQQCDKVAVMHMGAIVELDTPRNLMQKPESMFQAVCKGD